MFLGHKPVNLLDALISQGKIKADYPGLNDLKGLNDAQAEQTLLSANLATQEDISRAYSKIYSLPFIKLASQKIPLTTLSAIPKSAAESYKIIPYVLTDKKVEGKIEKVLKVATAEPNKLSADLKTKIEEINNKRGVIVELAIITPDDFKLALNNYKEQAPPPPPKTEEIKPEELPPKPAEEIKTIDLSNIEIPQETISKFPEDIARKYRMIVFEAPHPTFIKIAVADPYDKKMKEILDFVKEKNDIAIELYRASATQILSAMHFYKNESSPKMPSPPPPPLKENPIIQQSGLSELSPTNLPKTQFSPETSAKKEEKSEENLASPKPPEEKVPEVHGKDGEEKTQTNLLEQVNNLDQMLGDIKIERVEDLQAICEENNVPKMLAAIIALAVKQKSSDIHVEPTEKNLRVRFRVDGILRDIIILPTEVHPAIVSRIKILSNLKIDENRIPQDGRFDVITQGHAIDLRVSSMPTVHGEKIAMRILDKSSQLFTLEELGLAGKGLKILTDNIDKPFGIILSTGPTGSGKSTTLYAILNRISTASVNIVTLEDPVEYEIPGINQCQIKPRIGFTFANGLRSVLRQDPNVIMVGEIRDSDTASLAVHAALTGHLVLTTLHTNDAAGTLPRLMNMGIEPFLITSSINCIVAQRLVRRLCQKCRVSAHIPELVQKEVDRELANFRFPTPYKFFEGRGCSECSQGYKGRIGIFEVMPMTEEIENLTIAHRPASEIKTAAVKNGMVTMKQDGLIKALKGETSINEVLRVVTI